MSKQSALPPSSLKPKPLLSEVLLQTLATLESLNFDTLRFDKWQYEAIRNINSWLLTPNHTQGLGHVSYQRYCFSRLVAIIMVNINKPISLVQGGKVDKTSAEVYGAYLVRSFAKPGEVIKAQHQMIRSSLSGLAIHLGMSNEMLIKYQLVMINVWTFIEDEPALHEIFFGEPGIHHVVGTLVESYADELPHEQGSAMESMHCHVLSALNTLPKVREITQGTGIFLA